MKVINLIQADIEVVKEPTILKTLLGSCVAVCLWDEKNHIGGMCHYVSAKKEDKDPNSAYFGDVALKKLHQEMIKQGAKQIKAKIYGAGNVLKDPIVGKKCCDDNIEVAETYLKKNKIPVLERKLGGELPRTIKFNTSNFKVECDVINYNKKDIKLHTAEELGLFFNFMQTKTGSKHIKDFKKVIIFVNSRLDDLDTKNISDYLELLESDQVELNLLLETVSAK